jgi:kinetochore protein Spc24
MLPVMDPEEDYMTIVAAEENISSSETARKKELEEAHAKLKGPSAPISQKQTLINLGSTSS